MDDLQEDHDLGPHLLEFESMNLHVGIRLQFITHRRVKPVQHFSTLIGWIKDEYMSAKLPMNGGLPIPLIEGERLTIRVFSGINVCSFACTVERLFLRPLFYAHISFPDSIQGTSLRIAMRVKVAGGSADDCLIRRSRLPTGVASGSGDLPLPRRASGVGLPAAATCRARHCPAPPRQRPRKRR